MNSNPQGSYGEYRVLTASPVGLVRLLYEKAIAHVETARESLKRDDPEGRARSVTGAMTILSELMMSLNHEVAPELSGNLKSLYDYLQWRLLTGHAQRDDACFAEVQSLLRSMSEAWVVRTEAAPAPEAAPAEAAVAEPVAAAPASNPYAQHTRAQRNDGRMYL